MNNQKGPDADDAGPLEIDSTASIAKIVQVPQRRRRLPNRRAAETFDFEHAGPVQHGADPEAIRRALCRDASGNASGPLGRALDLIAERED